MKIVNKVKIGNIELTEAEENVNTEVGKLKQYIILPRKPKFSTGKHASQTAHASFMALENQRCKLYCEPTGTICGDNNEEAVKLVNKWKVTGQTVIVLECKHQNDLIAIDLYCKQWNIPGWLYIDEGWTECKPLSPTAFATGVLTEEQQIYFSKFKLFGSKR